VICLNRKDFDDFTAWAKRALSPIPVAPLPLVGTELLTLHPTKPVDIFDRQISELTGVPLERLFKNMGSLSCAGRDEENQPRFVYTPPVIERPEFNVVIANVGRLVEPSE